MTYESILVLALAPENQAIRCHRLLSELKDGPDASA